MTRIKLCGLSRPCDIEAANELMPEYVGFVFARKSRRYVSPERARELRGLLSREIQTVGVFVEGEPEDVAGLLDDGIIDIAQLHGTQDEEYISRLRALTDKPIIRAFKLSGIHDVQDAGNSTADYVLLDSGAGTGSTFNWTLARRVSRPYFLAGGLTPENVSLAIETLRPFAVDVSSGIESGGLKDRIKMSAFVSAVRKEDKL